VKGILKPIILAWSSRKVWSTLFSFGLMWGIHVMTVNHVYAVLSMKLEDGVTQAAISALVTLYTVTLGVIGVIIASFLGSSAFTSKFGISGAAGIAAQAINENRRSHEILETIEHVVDEGAPGAPARRPFNPDLEADGD